MLKLTDIARLPEPGDNAAIAVRTLEPGTRYSFEGRDCELSHTVLEGHRFAIRDLEAGEPLLSWGLPFGVTEHAIRAGTYLCNAAMLAALALRKLSAKLPPEPNFRDRDLHFDFDERGFRPGTPPEPRTDAGTFEGFHRPGGRGSGTRNFVVLLGVSSRAASFARALERELGGDCDGLDNVDGIVAATHTEGGGQETPNNRELVLRTLAGFMVHPNVGAVLCIDQGGEPVNSDLLKSWLEQNRYDLDGLVHGYHSIGPDLADSLAEAARKIRAWLPRVEACQRSRRPLSELRVALQCGGSDAFSGVSGNPLAGGVARELIRHGGAACLAETDELIGAEPYILHNTRDLDTARAFLDRIARFEERAAWHGQSVRDNATGGNKFRGLYNVTLKSIGAARKKDPDTRLEHVIDYAEPIRNPGFHFMDSPGNDLESIAGQVASGCNLIFFITGNGSITNFPFVPTVKIMTTTGRWNLMPGDMDVNAGRYLDGESMESLEAGTFDQAVRIASGERSAGERAGHAQVSIWRNWRQSGPSAGPPGTADPRLDGRPLQIRDAGRETTGVEAYAGPRGPAVDQVGLVLPTSLCSGQIAARIVDRLDAWLEGVDAPVNRFATLVHTEGCGASSGDNEAIYLRTMTGYLVHPCVRTALLLEHGCEHTHNDLFRKAMADHGIDPDAYGYASIQLDGGIAQVTGKVEQWFKSRLGGQGRPQREASPLAAIGVGITVVGEAGSELAGALAELGGMLAGAGGSVVIPSGQGLAQSEVFLRRLGLEHPPGATLAYGEPIKEAGMHVMDSPDGHLIETLSGLGATGVQILLVCNALQPAQGHPILPTLQVCEQAKRPGDSGDLSISEGADHETILRDLRRLLEETASGRQVPGLWEQGYSDFQISRGRLGISL